MAVVNRRLQLTIMMRRRLATNFRCRRCWALVERVPRPFIYVRRVLTGELGSRLKLAGRALFLARNHFIFVPFPLHSSLRDKQNLE
jgi:hypothetical protein